MTTQTAQIVAKLPQDIPAPKFQLFQQVRLDNRSRPVTVVGIAWVDVTVALIEGLGWCGWQYEVSYVYGLPQEQALDANDTTVTARESRLTAVEG